MTGMICQPGSQCEDDCPVYPSICGLSRTLRRVAIIEHTSMSGRHLLSLQANVFAVSRYHSCLACTATADMFT